MMNVLKLLWNSRKAWQVGAGTSAGAATFLVGLISAYKGWAPAEAAPAVTLLTVLMGLSFQAAGLASAALVAYEDYAVKSKGTPHPPQAATATRPPAGE